VVNLESRFDGLVFLLLLLWATPFASSKRSGMYKRHGSGLSAGFAGSPHALAVEVDAVGVVDQAVEDGVGVGGIADRRVPLIDGELAGDDGGGVALAILEDLQEVVASRGIERLEAPSRRG
jgi:hypothetical protein